MTKEIVVRLRSFEHSDFLQHSSFVRRHFLLAGLGMTKSKLAALHLPVLDEFVRKFFKETRWPLKNVAVASA
jgi:hypothetical protein